MEYELAGEINRPEIDQVIINLIEIVESEVEYGNESGAQTIQDNSI